jgi:hypothetical protein
MVIGQGMTMADTASLQDIIEAMASAVVEAQSRIEQHQIANIARYFDKTNKPLSVDLQLPNLSPNAAEDETHRTVSVPLIALVHGNQLKIKELEIGFDVELGEFSIPVAEPGTENAEDEPADQTWRGATERKGVGAKAGGGVAREKGATARVVIKIEGQEPPEGISRLLHHMIKTL